MTLPACLRAVGAVLRDTAVDWFDDDAPRLAASLSFYTALSLAPLLLLCISIAGLAVGEDVARGHVSTEAGGLLGEKGAEAVATVLANATDTSQGVLATMVSVVVLLFGASGVFGELQTAMNIVWEVKRKDGGSVWGLVRERFVSFAMVGSVAFLLLVSLVISAVLTAVTNRLDAAFESVPTMLRVFNILVSLAVTTGLFALVFKVVPDAEIRWRDVWGGALATAIFFMVGKELIGVYLGHSTVASSFGAAGSVVVVLVWVYYSTQLVFLGAELTQVLARRRGHSFAPSPNAVSTAERAAPETAPRR
jgi:membrane protein